MYRRSSMSSAALLLWGVALASAQPVPEALIDLTASSARVHAARPGQALAPAAAAGAAATVAAFLRAQGRSQAAVDSLAAEGEHTSPATGVTHHRYIQRVQGLDVYGTYVKAAVNGRGELVHLIELLANPAGPLVRATLGPEAALNAVTRQLYSGRNFSFRQAGASGNTIEFAAGDGFFHRNPQVTRIAVPLSTGALQEGYLVETWTQTDNQLHRSVVSASGRVLQSELRTANDTYNVFPEHPDVGTQSNLSGPGTGSAESPGGWTSGVLTGGRQYQFRMSGNNVHAYLDRDNNNAPDAQGVERLGPDFGVTVDKGADPTTPQNQEAAIVHLFYSNNVIHDKLYRHGFTETAKNFQEDNFRKGGSPNDSVLAEAQDGGGTNNANFATPLDGSRPRMQMYIWTFSSPNRDGDLDSDIVFHEYGHGLTWRMIGGMSGCMSGAIGEGASDTLSIWMNGNDVVGEYSYNNPSGIRRWPYNTYPLTYGQLTNEGVHAGGELFAAIMWRARGKFQDKNISMDDLWDAFVDGMNYIPSGPKYENMRDGMVQAAGALAASSKACLIYEAFAELGVGQGASGSCSVGGNPFSPRTTWRNTESFQVPAECLGDTPPPNAPPTASFTFTCTGLTCSFDGSASSDPGGSIVGYSWNFGDGSSGSGVTPSHTYASAGTYGVTLTVTDNEDNTASQTQNVTVTEPAPGGISLSVRAYKVQGLQKADLEWTGATAVKVSRTGKSSADYTLSNATSFTDHIDARGSGSYTYQVCETANPTTCSSQVTISF